jgi:hypothetical protein
VNPPPAIQFRPASETDLPFVFDAWRLSFRDSDFAYTLPWATYSPIQTGKMQAAVSQGTVTMACLSDDPDCLLGFAVHSKTADELTVIHFLYVKEWFRHRGIARNLLAQTKPSVPVVFTDITPDFHRLRKTHHLPYITARELEDFTTKNPENPMHAFAEWLEGRYYYLQQLRKSEA